MSTAPLTRDELVAGYATSGKPRSTFRVGAEFERHLLRADGTPLPYPGEPGIRWLIDRLAANGWDPYFEGPNVIAANRGEASVTLEPGGQFELSGAPFRTVGEVEAEARAFADEVDAALAGTGVAQVALGFTPYARIEDVGWVPKGRYVVMRDYLAHTGDLAHHMMKGTAAVQATYDYADEADCARKVRLSSLLGPLTTATFANSPWVEGRPSGHVSWRGKIWTRTDPARTGFPAVAAGFTFERWVDWLLDVPMMFKKDRAGAWQFARGQTFRQWMDQGGAEGPTAKDWELHLTSVFPEVRIKRTIEVRGADCVPLPLAMGFTALWRGLFYDDAALDRALGLAERFASHGTAAERFEEACRLGLEGRVGDRRMADWAAELVDLADAGLASLDRSGLIGLVPRPPNQSSEQRVSQAPPSDRRWLEPLKRQVATGESPGRTLFRQLGERPDARALAAASPMVPRGD